MINKTMVLIILTVCPALMMAQGSNRPDSINVKLHELDRMKGTWLLTYSDTARSGSVHRDTVLTAFNWSAKGDSLLGKQQIKTAGGVSYVYIVYAYSPKSGQFFYIESLDPNNYPSAAPLVVDGETWIYPNGKNRVLNVFSQSNSVITYHVQELQNGKWLTSKSGMEIKINE